MIILILILLFLIYINLLFLFLMNQIVKLFYNYLQKVKVQLLLMKKIIHSKKIKLKLIFSKS